MIRISTVFSLGVFIAIALACCAARADKPFTVKSHQVKQDDTYVYYSDTRSDGTETTRRVAKPKPRRYPQSLTLVATNDLPVQIQYVYAELYADGSVKTNFQYRTKTARERVRIKMPPMPEVSTQKPRGRADALRLAKERRRRPIKIDEELQGFKTMRRPDRVMDKKIIDGKLHCRHQSGKVTVTPLRRAVTARVKSAPVKQFAPSRDPEDYPFVPPGPVKKGEPINDNTEKERTGRIDPRRDTRGNRLPGRSRPAHP